MSARQNLAVFGPLLLAFVAVAVFGNDPAGWLDARAQRLARFRPNIRWRKR